MQKRKLIEIENNITLQQQQQQQQKLILKSIEDLASTANLMLNKGKFFFKYLFYVF